MRRLFFSSRSSHSLRVPCPPGAGLLCAGLLLLHAAPGHAQTPLPILPAQAAPPAQTVTLLVGAGDDPARITHRFGNVTALAPPTMVVLGLPPPVPNPYDGMPPGDAVKLLAGTLTPDQWKALLGTRGLGLPDLVSAPQRSLFFALFPHDTLRVQWDRPGEPNRDEDIQDLTAQIPQARLRLGQQVMLGLPVEGHPNIHTFGMSFEPDGAPKRYVQVGGAEADTDFVDGARVRAVVPNTPKTGALDFDAPALQTLVPCAGAKTVGQLLRRIGETCRTEIYPDARIENKRLAVTAGAPPSARAGDLLRAVALCVTGTFRKVGPAFVLADDIPGSGTRRQLWADFERRADQARHAALDQAGEAITNTHTLDDVSAQDEPLGLTPAQKAAFHKQHAGDLADHRVPSGDMMDVNLPFRLLTPAQQQVARHSADFYSRNPEDDRPTTKGLIMVQSQATLQLVLPSLDGPVDMEYRLDGLFQPSEAALDRQITQADTRGRADQAQWDARRKQAQTLPLLPLLEGPPHRAVLANPRTSAEAEALAASAKALGLNEVWLDVFSEGAAHTEALDTLLHATQSSGIRVYAALDLLRWGPDAPPDAVDLSVRGETSAADAARRGQERELEAARRGWNTGPAHTLPPQQVMVSPLSPLVRARLAGLVQSLTRHAGLAGLVWRETAAPGYLAQGRMVTLGAPSQLGYGEAARLAFLRRAHADPVDLFPSEYRQGHADTRLPLFDDREQDLALWARWGRFRIDENLVFLHALSAAAPQAQTIVIAARGPSGRDMGDAPAWYGTWDRVAHPPADRDEFGPGEAWQSEQAQARAQSRLALYPVRVPLWVLSLPGQPLPGALDGLKQQISDAFPAGQKSPWDGYVLDATMPRTGLHPGLALPTDPLAVLRDPPAMP